MSISGKLIPMAAAIVLMAGPSRAQSLDEALARDCGTRNANYCWETSGDGYGTPEQCIYATISLFCPPPPEGETPTEWYGGPRDYAFNRLFELEHFCSGRITCGH